MNQPLPRTPFSTPLSGSARETEIRIRNIMSGPKKRPPVLFLALMFSVCIFCGNLVSCNVAEPEESAPAKLDNAQQGDVSQPEEHEPASVTYTPTERPMTEDEQRLLDALVQAADQEQPFQSPAVQLMNCIQKDGYILGAVFVEDYWENTLILGVMNEETREVDEPVFRCSVHNGAASAVTFRNADGEYCLLYTLNGQENGQYDGEAGVVRFNGRDFTWEWPVEGDARYPETGVQAVRGAREPYQKYWSGHLAVPAPGGVDVYAVNPDFQWGQEDPWSMWQLESDELFYDDPSSAEQLPMPVYFQSLRWLIGHTNDPGGWRVVSLALNEEKCDAGKRIDCYILRAQSWSGAEVLAADLFFNYDLTGNRKSYDGLDYGEVRDEDRVHPAAPEVRDGDRVHPAAPEAPTGNTPAKDDETD